MKKEITVFAPASVTNVGCGFDVLGFAIDFPGDEVTIRLTENPEIKIVKITGDNGKISKEIDKNTAGISVKSFAEHLNIKNGIEIEIHKKMGIGSGLGSSAASSVAAVFALNNLLDNPLSKNDIFHFALEGEKLTSGGKPHADNVAACLFGGFTIVKNNNNFEVISVPYPENLWCVVIHPDVEVSTSYTRTLLNNEIPLQTAVKQMSNVAALITGLTTNDFGLIKNSIHDLIAEPIRRNFIPEYEKLKHTALENGAYGCNISGSGPSVFAFADNENSAKIIGNKMGEVLKAINIKYNLYVSKINNEGPKILRLT